MKIKDVLENIKFNISTINELSNKCLNDVFSTRQILAQLKYAVDKYAKVTKGIKDIYSIPLTTDTEWVTCPPLSLQSESFFMIYVWVGYVKYLMIDPGLTYANSSIRYQTIKGIPRWFVPWKDKAYINPVSGTIYKSTTLAGNINATDTVINLTNATSFLPLDGRITIDNEKINYKYRTGNVLYNCERGIEQTIAASHTNLTNVLENNMWIYYYRMHTEITDDIKTWDREFEVPEEHIEMITDYTSYKLLSKVDNTRASFYKLNFDEWLDRTAKELKAGRTKMVNSGHIRNEFDWQSDNPNYFL